MHVQYIPYGENTTSICVAVIAGGRYEARQSSIKYHNY